MPLSASDVDAQRDLSEIRQAPIVHEWFADVTRALTRPDPGFIALRKNGC
jgi:hypothetical protein